MEIISIRCSVASVWIGILMFVLIGCSTTIEPQEEEAFSTLVNTPVENSLSISFEKVSFISDAGTEVELDPASFQQKWDEFTPILQERDMLSQSLMFTFVVWDKLNQPYVLHISREGIKLGQQYYQGEKMDQFLAWLREEIGREYMNSLSTAMILEAKDMGVKKEIPASLATDINALLKTATLVKGQAWIQAPLYPYYQLNIGQKGEQFLEVSVISPTLLVIEDGEHKWYLQLNSSIFSLLKDVIPITHYSNQHIKYLFQAEDIHVTLPDTDSKLSDMYSDTLRIESVVHQIARLFAQGHTRSTGITSIETQAQLLFYFANQTELEIGVGEDYFIFAEQVYELPNVEQTIVKIISNGDKNSPISGK